MTFGRNVWPALERFDGGVPAEGGALDPGGEGMDAGEGCDVADLLGFLAGGHDLVEILIEFCRLRRTPALEQRGHQRGAGLRDGAAGAVEGNVPDPVAVHPEVNAALVAARRIVAVCHAVGCRQPAPVPRALVMVEDDLLVEFAEIGGHGRSAECRMRNAEWQTGSVLGFGAGTAPAVALGPRAGSA